MCIKILHCINLQAWFFSSISVSQGVTIKSTGCGFDLHSRKFNIYLNVYFHFFALESRRWIPLLNTKCLQNSAESGERSVLILSHTTPHRFPLPTLLSAGYSVKLIWFDFYFSLIRYGTLKSRRPIILYIFKRTG